MKESLKKITLLHSNDIHGKFVGTMNEDGTVSGSLAQLAGYITKAKEEDPNTIYCNAGDVFQGSLIDSEFLGLSTMDILNLVDIDVMTLGNHELDYGISHMMLVDRYTDFPIINTNLQIKTNDKRLFKPFQIIRLENGVNVLFIGLLTEGIIDQTKNEGLVGSFVKVADCISEIERCKNKVQKKGKRIDMTVLLTHIGYEADLELARSLDPSLGVDIIVGGHSHTYIDEPAVENGIVIVQAGMENTHFGRFDILYDKEARKIADWKWEMIPVDDKHCPTDKFVRAMVNTYVLDIDEKYGAVITRLKRTLDNYGRGNATEVGQLFADAFADALNLDIFFLAASSTRCYEMDMTVTLQDLREAYPYDGKIYSFKVRGEQLYMMIWHMLRSEVIDDWEDTFFHTSKNLHIDYDRDNEDLVLTYCGKTVGLDDEYMIGMQEFYFLNSEAGVGISPEELVGGGRLKVAAPDAFEVLQDYFREHSGLGGPVDGRFKIHGTVRGKHYD